MQIKLQLAFATMVSMAASTQSASAQFTQDCSESQTSQVAAYQTYAGLQLLTASDYIGRVVNEGEDASRFDYWFGNHEPAIVDQVSAMMENIYYTLEHAQYVCDPCDAPDLPSGTVAYVYPDDPEFHVYLCDDFFDQTAPDRLNTWVFGVVSHEMSHFFGTVDSAVPGGPAANSAEAAHQIALDDPSLAANLSYAYQFFLSNTSHP